jgi:hypothetical protein
MIDLDPGRGAQTHRRPPRRAGAASALRARRDHHFDEAIALIHALDRYNDTACAAFADDLDLELELGRRSNWPTGRVTEAWGNG